MSQLVTQTTTYGLNSDKYSISTLSEDGGCLEIMAGDPHDKTATPLPIADFKSDQSVKFHGVVDLSAGVVLPADTVTSDSIGDKMITTQKLADGIVINGSLNGTADRAIADGSGTNIADTYAKKTDLDDVKSSLSQYAKTDNPTFPNGMTVKGTMSVPTPETADNSTKPATTEYVQANLAKYASLASEQTISGKTNFLNLNVPDGSNQTFAGETYYGTFKWIGTKDYRHFEFSDSGRKAGCYVSLEYQPDQNSWYRILTEADVTTIQMGAVPTGTILAWAGFGGCPSGFLWCNGAWVSRTDYADLFRVIGTRYGAGDGSTSFALPSTNRRFLEGTTTLGEVGQYISAGLPNITQHNHGFGQMVNNNGEFIATDGNATFTVWGNPGVRGWNGKGDGGTYTAGARNYANMVTTGANATAQAVQPASLRIVYIIKY